ncbi:hypothetical protein FQN52_000880 [Onygenales sp. PD_12]|nr:hypothetical protein FQN52_000880 [Onygenales sp. PD_12]
MEPIREDTAPQDSERLFWSPEDRAGSRGVLDRLKRKRRLRKTNNQDEEGRVLWTPDILFRYVPTVFESARVPQKTAGDVLTHAISKSFFSIFPSAYMENLIFVGNPKRRVYELLWHGTEPIVPEVLRDIRAFALVEQEPE